MRVFSMALSVTVVLPMTSMIAMAPLPTVTFRALVTTTRYVAENSLIQCIRCNNKQQNKIEPPRGKTNNVVFEQVRHKLGCTATEAG